jgi:hypothetical protein
MKSWCVPRVQTVIERQERVLAKRDAEDFLSHRQHTVDFWNWWASTTIAVEQRFLHLETVFGLMP